MTYSGENRVVVDWDGTCVENVWPKMGDWLPGAREALTELLRQGREVVIFSTRLAPVEFDERTDRPPGEQEAEVAAIRKMLNDAGLRRVTIWNEPWKPGGMAYIDDKAVRFDGDWPAVIARLAPKAPPTETVLVEAGHAVDGARERDYGHPLDDFARIVGMVNSLFSHKLAVPFQPEDWPLIMECVKCSRQVNRHGRDNLIDGAGYWRTLEKLVDERERRAA